MRNKIHDEKLINIYNIIYLKIKKLIDRVQMRSMK